MDLRFEKRTINRKPVYKCKQCDAEVLTIPLTRQHICDVNDEVIDGNPVPTAVYVNQTPNSRGLGNLASSAPTNPFPRQLGRQQQIQPQQQPPWYFQEMLQQEKQFRETQLKQQQEMHQQQLQIMQQSTEQRFARMESIFDKFADKLEGLGNNRTTGDQQAEGRSDKFNKKIKCPKWPVTDS